jgi:hypothetical protein
MARIRTIKPEFFASQDIENLPRITARITFAGIWTQADDEGRMRYDDPRVLKGAIWPLADWHTTQDVAEDVACLVEAGLLIYYVVTEDSSTLPGVLSERGFLAVANWHKHQKINRATPSKLPAPVSESIRPMTCTVANRVSRYGRTVPEWLADDAISPYGQTHGGLTEDSRRTERATENVTESSPPPAETTGPSHSADRLTEDSPQEVEVEVEVEPSTSYSAPPAVAGVGGSSAAVVDAVVEELDLGLPPVVEAEIGDEEPPPVTARDIAARWIDACRSIGAPPDRRVIGRVSSQAKQLLEAGADPERLLAAAWSCGEQGYDDVGKELRMMSGRRRAPLPGAVNGHARPAGRTTERLAALDALRDPNRAREITR